MADYKILTIPFARDAVPDMVNDIPDAPSVPEPQLASWQQGFPYITTIPLVAGGIPPEGQDFNGILRDITEHIVHQNKGGMYKFAPEVVAAGGYPEGAVLAANDGLSLWVSLVDSNVEDFNSGTPTQWARIAFTGLDALLNGKVDKTSIVQVTGASTTNIMSQRAVTDAIGTLPLGYFSGYQLSNNSSAPNTTIDVGAGAARSSDNTVNVTLTGTLRGILQSSGDWAAGDNQNKLDTGARANSTWYHVFAIRRTSDGYGDILFSTSATAPTMPSGYAGFRRIGAIKTDGSGNILAFTNVGDEFIWTTLPLDVNLSGAVDGAYVLSVPIGVRVMARIGLFMQGGDSVTTVRPTDSAAYTPSYTSYIGGNVMVSSATPEYHSSESTVLTDNLGRAYFVSPASAVPATTRAVTYSYREIGR